MNAARGLARAREHLAVGPSGDLRYAALELRMCIEVMTYLKLRSFQNELPRAALEKIWQPPKLIRYLLQFDPYADQSFRLYMSEPLDSGGSNEPNILVGEHKSFTAAWLNKHWHKLGSWLHATRDGQERTAEAGERIHADLVKIASEIEDRLSSSITGMSGRSRRSLLRAALQQSLWTDRENFRFRGRVGTSAAA